MKRQFAKARDGRAEAAWAGVGPASEPSRVDGRAMWLIVALAAAIVAGNALVLGWSPRARRVVTASWRSDAALFARLHDVEDDDAADAATQTLYDRLRSGALDDDALTRAARAMWSAQVCVDDPAIAGRDVAISVFLRSPIVDDERFADGRPGPELEYRLAAARIDGGEALALRDAAPMRVPLTRFSPTTWCRAAVPASTPEGPTTMWIEVEFAVRARPGGPIVGRWTQCVRQAVTIAADDSPSANP